MRTFTLLVMLGILLGAKSPSLAQTTNLKKDWNTFEKENTLTAKRGSISLASWGLANIVSGSIAAPLTNGTQRNFHLMNLSWGLVNFGIALPGVIAYSKKKEHSSDVENVYKKFRSSKTVYLLNAGLDIGYTLSGLWMHERSKRIVNTKRADMVQGFGYSVMLQGIYLLTYDAVMYGIYASRNKKQDALLKRSFIKF